VPWRPMSYDASSQKKARIKRAFHATRRKESP
jgi:hypothetical protein